MDENSNKNNFSPFTLFPLSEKMPYWKRFTITKLENANEDQLNNILKKYIKSLESYFNPKDQFEGNLDDLNRILAAIRQRKNNNSIINRLKKFQSGSTGSGDSKNPDDDKIESNLIKIKDALKSNLEHSFTQANDLSAINACIKKFVYAHSEEESQTWRYSFLFSIAIAEELINAKIENLPGIIKTAISEYNTKLNAELDSSSDPGVLYLNRDVLMRDTFESAEEFQKVLIAMKEQQLKIIDIASNNNNVRAFNP